MEFSRWLQDRVGRNSRSNFLQVHSVRMRYENSSRSRTRLPEPAAGLRAPGDRNLSGLSTYAAVLDDGYDLWKLRDQEADHDEHQDQGEPHDRVRDPIPSVVSGRDA